MGAWGCFDEFNRLEERMLSAVSQQVQTIQEALKEHASPEKDSTCMSPRVNFCYTNIEKLNIFHIPEYFLFFSACLSILNVLLLADNITYLLYRLETV